MKISPLTALVSAALIAAVSAQPAAAPVPSGTCTCYGDVSQERTRFLQEKNFQVESVRVESRLRGVPEDVFDRAAMRVLQSSMMGKGGKGGEGKKGEGKKGPDDDYFTVPDGDDELDDLVDQYCSCTEVCDVSITTKNASREMELYFSLTLHLTYSAGLLHRLPRGAGRARG